VWALEIDLRGFLGIDPAVPPGYETLSYTVSIKGAGTKKQFAGGASNLSAGDGEGMGIHVGHVVVDGAFAGDKIFNRFPDAASRDEGLISIEAIVNAFAFLYGQPSRGWSFEVDVRTSQEKW
jgi:hypothetical protein